MFDVCIIGAGAAGLAAANRLSKAGKTVIIIDSNEKAGKKLYATGNGRCNLTNEYMNIKDCYRSNYCEYEAFIKSVITDNTTVNVISFCNSLGISTINKDGYYYPRSMQASSFVWALLDSLNNKVTFEYKTKVQHINKCKDGFAIKTDTKEIYSKTVILACGSRAYESLGGSESGYCLAKELGHHIVDVRPALCSIKVKEKLDSIAGVRAYAKASLIVKDKVICEEYGEVQFTKEALSGIVIFNLSSIAGLYLSNGIKPVIRLDLLADRNDKVEYTDNRSLLGCLNGYVNDKLAGYIINKNNWTAKSKDSNEIKSVLEICEHELHNLDFCIDEVSDWEHAQICAGGVSLAEVDSNTMESKLEKNVYIVGEMLDVDGKCGGYNLTFALLSGIKAGEHICCE